MSDKRILFIFESTTLKNLKASIISSFNRVRFLSIKTQPLRMLVQTSHLLAV